MKTTGERERWRGGVRAAVLTALVSVAIVPTARAETGPPTEVVAGALRNWPPHYALDDAGEPSGFAIDLMRAVARRAKLGVSYRVFDTFPEMVAALEAGEIDVIPNFGITEERRARVAYTAPVETFAIELFVRAGMPGVRSLDDLRGERIAAVRSNAAVELLAERGVEAIVYPDVPGALFDLLAGRVEALAYPESVLRARARQAGVVDHIRAVGPPLGEIKRAIAVRRGDDALLGVLDAAVHQVVGTEEYRRIYARWHGAEPPYWTVTRVAWVAAIAAGLLLVVVAAWRLRVLAAHNRELRARVAERDAAQAALAESEAKYRQIVETSGEGVWVIDRDAVTTFVNRRMAEMLGLEPDDMVGRPMFEFFDEDLAAQARENLDRRREGVEELHDFRLRRADGKQVEVLMAASPILEEGEFCGALAMVADVTERRRLERELRQSQKVEALGRLAGGVAHDFNNLLVVVNAAVSLARRKLAGDHPVAGDLAEIDKAAERARALTSQLLAFSRKQVTHPEVVRPAARIADNEALLHRLIAEDVELSVPRRDDGGAVKIDPGQLDQVVFNLVANARDAMPDGGHLDIRVEDATVAAGGEVPAGDYVVVTVEDDGLGMSEEVRANVFEPFFTTKEEGRGTGLGLATCYGIVTQVGGHIAVASKPGEGARFRVYLPRTEARAERAEPESASTARPARSLGVLLVEDEPAVRRLVRRVLADRTHTVIEASSAEHALQLCRQRPDEIDVLLTDLVMPGLNGRDLARRAGELIAELRVVYMSGYADRTLGELGERESFLAKPFTPDDLVRALDA